MARTGAPPRARWAALPRAAELLRRRDIAQALRALRLPPEGDDLDRYLVATHASHTSLEQAEELGASIAAVRSWRDRLYRQGAIRRVDRRGNVPITAEEIAAVRELYLDGYGAGEIAALRGVADHRVELVVVRAGLSHAPRARRLNAQDVGAILGVHRGLIARWALRGLLPDRRHRVEAGVAHSWTRDDLIAFVRNRRTWPHWAPAQITDPPLRRLAEEARRAARAAWYQQEELALLLGVDPGTLVIWRRERPGLLDGLEVYRPGGPGRYYWLDDDLAAELADWGGRLRRLGSCTTPGRVLAARLRERLFTICGRAPDRIAAAD